jgi:hypothetical protein
VCTNWYFLPFPISKIATERDQYFQVVDQNIDNALKVKSDVVIAGGDFNARCQHWWLDDINTVEGETLYDISVKHSLFQLIHEPTRITATSKCCLDLIFCNNPGFVNNTEVFFVFFNIILIYFEIIYIHKLN